MSPRRPPVAHLDVRHFDAEASQHLANSERRRLGIPEPVAPKPLPAPSLADVQRSGKASTPPAPGRSPVSPPSPDRGGRAAPPAAAKPAPPPDSVTLTRAEWKRVERLIDAAAEGLRRNPPEERFPPPGPLPKVNRQPGPPRSLAPKDARR